MKRLKIPGLALVLVALVLTAAVTGSASATTLEVGGVTQTGSVSISGSLASGTSAVLSRTDGTLANTCTTSAIEGKTEKDFTSKPTGSLSKLTFESCTRPVTVHQAGKLYVEQIASTTNGTVFSEEAEVTVSTPFGTVNCKTGSGTDVGTLTGVASGNATMDINAVLNCGFLLPSASWKGTYTVTSPSGLGVGEGGGGEGAAMDLSPDGYVWTGWLSKQFDIKNTGWSSFKIDAWYWGNPYEVHDPNGCLGKTLTIFSTCSIYVTGKPTYPSSTLKVEGSKNGVVVASDTSSLN